MSQDIVRIIPETRRYCSRDVFQTAKSWARKEPNPYLYFCLAHGGNVKFRRESLNQDVPFLVIVKTIAEGNPFVEANLNDLCRFYFFYTDGLQDSHQASRAYSPRLVDLLNKIEEISGRCLQAGKNPMEIVKPLLVSKSAQNHENLFKSNTALGILISTIAQVAGGAKFRGVIVDGDKGE